MRIEVREKGTLEFYREIVNITSQYQRLMKNPEGKLKDTFRMIKSYLILCAVLFVLVLLMGIFWGMDALTILALVVLVGAIAVSGIQLKRLNDMVDVLMEDPRTAVIIMDENGVEFNKEDAEKLRISYENVAFLRVFEESVGIFAKSARAY